MKYKFDEFVSNLENRRWNKEELAFLKELSTYCYSNPTVSRQGLIKWSVQQGYINRTAASIQTKVFQEIIKLKQETCDTERLLKRMQDPDFPIYVEENTLEALNKTM